MSYAPFEFRVFPLFIIQIILSIFSILITVKMYSKWRERKVLASLYLTIVFMSLTVALVGLTLGLAEAVITGYYKEIYRASLPLAYTMVIFVDIFYFMFIYKITERGKSLIFPLVLIGFIIIILLWLPWNWWGAPREDFVGQPYIRLYSTGILVIFSYAIFIYIAILILRVKKKALNDEIAKVGLSLLFYAVLCMILNITMNICDVVLITLYGHPGYSEFVYVSWIFAILVYVFSYLSLVMPDWLKRWILKRNSKN